MDGRTDSMSGLDAGAIAAARKLWDQAVLLDDQAIDHPSARAYFENRGIRLEDLPAWNGGRGSTGRLPTSIRYHAEVPYALDLKAGSSPCLLLRVDDREGHFRSVHRIWLEKDGSPRKRSDVGKGKEKLGWKGIEIKGCAIRFGEPSAEIGLLVLCEGPETGLAIAAATGCCVWVCGGPGLMNVELPAALVSPDVAIVREVVFMGDHEQARIFRADETMIGRDCLMRSGWNFSASGAVRIRAKYPQLRARVAVPGMDFVFTDGPHFKAKSEGEVSGTALDSFAETVDPEAKVDWLDICNSNGPDVLLKALDQSRPLTVSSEEKEAGELAVPAAYLATAPLARKWLTEGVDREHLIDLDKQGGLKKERERERKAAEQQRIKEAIPQNLFFPKHEALRAQYCLEALFKPENPIGECWKLFYWVENSQWMLYTGTCWKLLKEHEIPDHLVAYLQGLVQENKSGKMVDVDLTNRSGVGMANQIRPLVSIRTDGLPCMAPSSFDDQGKPIYQTALDRVARNVLGDREGAANFLPFNDGLVLMDSFLAGKPKKIPHTSRLISRSVVPFDLDLKELQRELDRDPDGDDCGGELVRKYCPIWLEKLDDAFEGCAQSIYELQKVGGYLLTDDMTQEVLPFIIGPPRSFKGTVIMALAHAIGIERCHITAFSSIGDKNETYSMVGRRVAFLTDAQDADPRDMPRIVEQLKTISAGDPQSVMGKFKDKNPFVYLPIVPFIASNTVPYLIDPSNALASRALVFRTRKSYVGREDRTLKARIRKEAFGIMLWCLFGLRSLRKDGRFFQPESSKSYHVQLKRRSSPISAFLSDCGVVHDKSEVGYTVFYTLYKKWAHEWGLGTQSKDKFFNNLLANVSNAELATVKMLGSGVNGKTLKVIKGVRPRMNREESKPAVEPAAIKVHEWQPNDWDDFGFSLTPGIDTDGGAEAGGIQYPQHRADDFGVNA